MLPPWPISDYQYAVNKLRVEKRYTPSATGSTTWLEHPLPLPHNITEVSEGPILAKDSPFAQTLLVQGSIFIMEGNIPLLHVPISKGRGS